MYWIVKTIFKEYLRRKNNAISSLPDDKRNSPQELEKFGDWQYGKGSTAWRIVTKKIKDSEDILA